MNLLTSPLRRLTIFLLAVITAVAGMQTASLGAAAPAHASESETHVPFTVLSDVPGVYTFKLTGFTEETIAVAPHETVTLVPDESTLPEDLRVELVIIPENARTWYWQYFASNGSPVVIRIYPDPFINPALGSDYALGATFLPALPDLEASEISVSDTSIPADGVTQAQIQVTVQGAETGQPSANQIVTLTTEGGGAGVKVSEVTDQGDGTYTASISSTTPGVITVHATVRKETRSNWPTSSKVTEEAIQGTATLTVSELPATAATSSWSVAPESTQHVGETFTARAKIHNELGEPVGAGVPVTFHTAAGVNGHDSAAATTIETDARGEATFEMTARIPGSYAVSASLDGQRIQQPKSLSFTPGPPDAAASQLSVSATEMNVAAHRAETVTATVTLRDRYGNLVPADTAAVELSTTRGTLSPTQSVGEGTGAFHATLSAVPNDAGATAQVGFTLNGYPAEHTTSVRFFATELPTAPLVTTNVAGYLSGTADPETTVLVRSEAQLHCTAPVSATGSFSCPDGSAAQTTGLGPGTYQLVARDASGSESEATEATVLAAPIVHTTHGGTAIGVADPHTEVRVLTLAGVLVCSSVSDATGAWECAGLPAGLYTVEQIRDTARSWPATLSVTPAPVVTSVSGNTVAGTGVAGAEVVLVTPDTAAEVCRVTVTSERTWACNDIGAGSYEATQIGADGNASTAVTVSVTPVRIAAPVLEATNGDAVSGHTAAGNTVQVRDGAGTVLCSTSASSDGSFFCPLSPAAEFGTLLNATGSDDLGNTSDPAWVRVGGAQLVLSTAELTRGATLSITVTGLLPNETVQAAVHSDPHPLGSVTADENGGAAFTFTVPEDFTSGAHEVRVLGERSGSLTAPFTITVAETELIGEPAPSPSTPAEVRETDAQPEPAAPHLEATGGMGLRPLLWGGAGLLVSAGTLWLLVRRTRQREEAQPQR